MPSLEPIISEGSLDIRPSRSSVPIRPNISRVLSGQHLDDQFTYQESSTGNGGSSSVDEGADISEDVSTEGNQELREKVPDEEPDFDQMALNRHDLEAPLEKKASKKSVKDQNLVSIPLPHLWNEVEINQG